MPGTFLPEFELYVMLSVARLGDEAYGASMRREIERRTGRPVSVGALYSAIGRLEEKGFLTSVAAEPEPGQRGRPRKYCHLTAAGLEATRHSAEMLRRMMDGVPLAHQPAGEGS
jgi:PadR family transcriptional regulator PadR